MRRGVNLVVGSFLLVDYLMFVRFSNGLCGWVANEEEMFLF